jgi:hypothetical protein
MRQVHSYEFAIFCKNERPNFLDLHIKTVVEQSQDFKCDGKLLGQTKTSTNQPE